MIATPTHQGRRSLFAIAVWFFPLFHEAELCQRPRPSIILSFEKGRKYVA
jgi:hypothetical protein